jgi:hypothetical protein
MNARQPAYFRQDFEGVHYHARTYVHHVTHEELTLVLRAIRRLHDAGRPINRIALVAETGVLQTQVSVVLKWLTCVVAAWRGRRCHGGYSVTDRAAWQRQVAARLLAIDDVEDVSDADVADVFGDPSPVVEEPEAPEEGTAGHAE